MSTMGWDGICNLHSLTTVGIARKTLGTLDRLDASRIHVDEDSINRLKVSCEKSLCRLFFPTSILADATVTLPTSSPSPVETLLNANERASQNNTDERRSRVCSGHPTTPIHSHGLHAVGRKDERTSFYGAGNGRRFIEEMEQPSASRRSEATIVNIS
jgi:hypothetical protein